MAEPAPVTDLRPAEPAPAVPQPSVTQLVSGIIDDAGRLAKQQVDMLKSEFQEDLRRTRRALEFGGIGIVLGTAGALTLVFFLVELLHEQFGFKTWSSAWSSFARSNFSESRAPQAVGWFFSSRSALGTAC